MIKLEVFSEIYVDKSWKWLNDPEIKFLTNTPDFSKDRQLLWFNGLERDNTYKIWGVSYNNVPVGIFGIKDINFASREGEYWGYIGEKKYWGLGIGSKVMDLLLEIAIDELHLQKLYLKVIPENRAAIRLYNKFDFFEIERKDGNIIMVKNIKSL